MNVMFYGQNFLSVVVPSPVVKNFTQAVLSDTGTVTSPSDTAIGDLVICLVWSQGTNIPTHTIAAGFIQARSHSHDDGTTDGRLSVGAKMATVVGAQSYAAFTIAGAVAGQTCAAILTVTGADTTPAGSWPQGSVTNTGNQPPDPPSLAALTGSKLVLAIAGWHVTTAGATAATVMANYTLNINGPAGSHLTHLAVAARALTGLSNATEDPAAFGDNVTPNGSAAMTIAVASALGVGQVASDTFDGYANGAQLGAQAGWTSFGGVIEVVKPGATGDVRVNSSSTSGVRSTIAGFTENQYAEIVMGTLTGAASIGVAVSVLDGNNWYIAQYYPSSPTTIYVGRFVAGAYADLVTTPSLGAALVSGDVLRLERSGSGSSARLQVKVNGVVVSALASIDPMAYIIGGTPGIFAGAATTGQPTAASWSGGNI